MGRFSAVKGRVNCQSTPNFLPVHKITLCLARPHVAQVICDLDNVDGGEPAKYQESGGYIRSRWRSSFRGTYVAFTACSCACRMVMDGTAECREV